MIGNASDPLRSHYMFFSSSKAVLGFVYASLTRLLVLKLVLSMSASDDVLALASLEVDLSSTPPGSF
ncbi:hypothetical protein SAY87_013851 [Trapa incisa]|uniref:Uncharacterized protein n=1 Tax=Trapa incisa TaxID=236973 RepID=A0AAN7K9B6_9MYRT|nr:hypothetical protein SAY87_013851 [Trapa incisa]